MSSALGNFLNYDDTKEFQLVRWCITKFASVNIHFIDTCVDILISFSKSLLYQDRTSYYICDSLSGGY